MLYYGEFLTQAGETCRVEITTGGDRADSLEIGGASSGLLFTDNPVETVCEVNDTFDHLIRTSATIRVLTRGYVSDLFSSSPFSTEVRITTEGRCDFLGFLEPRTYSQPFSDVYDELELNCIDLLSALQYRRYGDVGAPGVDYESLRGSAGMKTFGELVSSALTRPFAGGGGAFPVWDSSLTVPEAANGSPWDSISVNELLFLGDDEDGVWTMQEVVEEVFRYLNLHARQEGDMVKIFSLDRMKRGTFTKWTALSASATEYPAKTALMEITAKGAMGTDARISVGEVYNRIELTCDVKDIDTVVESPLDEENMTDPYPARQLFMTEYIDSMEKNTMDGGERMQAMIQTGRPQFKENKRRDWYLRMKDSMKWRFLIPNTSEGNIDVSSYFASGQYQQRAINLLSLYPGSCLASFGKVEYDADKSDNSLTPRIDMTDCLVVAVNGNGIDTEAGAYPDAATLKASIPVAEYTGGVSGGSFSPADSQTTNYIVIAGKILLMPLLKDCESPSFYGRKWSQVAWPDISGMNETFGKVALTEWFGSMPGKEGSRLYVCRWWDCFTPYSTPQDSTGATPQENAGGNFFWPPVDDVPEFYPFNYSAVGNGQDTISKVAALECMLIIGDKCVVETGTQGRPSDYEWKTYKTREQCASDDEYYSQSFSIGFDPKIGDKLIGQEYSIQNNLSFEMGLDLEGMGIPIKRSDRVSGKVTFRILGPVFLMWNNVTRRHRTFFRPVKWGDGNIPLMSHVQSIVVKDFSVTVASDNGLLDTSGDGEIVYTSDTDESFINVREDLTFRLTTALTRSERLELGVSDSVKLSAPVLSTTGEPLLKLRNAATGETAKPEQLYVDARWREWHTPRVVLEQGMKGNREEATEDHRFIHPALPGKTFYILGKGRNIIENRTNLILKECDL